MGIQPLDTGFAPFVRPAHIVNGINFDGTNDYLTRGAGLTGASDSKTMTGSFWINVAADNTLYRVFNSHTSLAGAAATLVMRINKHPPPTLDGKIQIVGENSAGTLILDVSTANNAILATSGWQHVMFSFDMSDTGKRHVYVDDASNLVTVTTYTDDTFDHTVADWAIGAMADGNGKLNGDLAEFWFDDSYLDLSLVANRRKFIRADGRPENLGADGSGPTGSAPLIYLSGATAAWHTNKGAGGGLTENGALADAATSPSD